MDSGTNGLKPYTPSQNAQYINIHIYIHIYICTCMGLYAFASRPPLSSVPIKGGAAQAASKRSSILLARGLQVCLRNAHTSLNMHVCMYVCIYIYVDMCVYVYIYICSLMCIYICIYGHIYICI